MNIPFVIVAADRQMHLVKRLQKHCLDLDGTEIVVLRADPSTNLPYPHCNNATFHQAANYMQGRPFGWLEPDSIPIKAGWATELTREYYRLGKPFMLSADSHPPYDLVGGIGIYGSDAHSVIPRTIDSGGFDGWMIKNIDDLISRTSLIQHSYGKYDHNGDCVMHRFPRDEQMIRSETVLFHRDKRQDLILSRQLGQNVFMHSGCMGDTIAALPVMRQLGGGHLIMTQRNNKRILRGKRYEMLKPLLECQPYIQSVLWEEDPQGTHDFTNFRKVYKSSRSLTDSQAEWIGVKEVDKSPWLSVNVDPRATGRVCLARTDRYQRQGFPWASIVRKFKKDELFFVGTREEHESLQVRTSYRFEWIETKDLLEVAQLIAGSKLFIGNQSSPCWIAMALGHPLLQETHEWIQDSMIQRDNAQFYGYGTINLDPYRSC